MSPGSRILHSGSGRPRRKCRQSKTPAAGQSAMSKRPSLMVVATAKAPTNHPLGRTVLVVSQTDSGLRRHDVADNDPAKLKSSQRPSICRACAVENSRPWRHSPRYGYWIVVRRVEGNLAPMSRVGADMAAISGSAESSDRSKSGCWVAGERAASTFQRRGHLTPERSKNHKRIRHEPVRSRPDNLCCRHQFQTLSNAQTMVYLNM